MGSWLQYSIIALLLSSTASARPVELEQYPVGQIVDFVSSRKGDSTLWKEKKSALGREIRLGDTIMTVAGQRLTAKLIDGTVINLAASSAFKVTKWYRKKNDEYLERIVEIPFGLADISVKKVYSQAEPLYFKTPHAVAAVRGTRFVLEVSEGGHLVGVRTQTQKDVLTSRKETELHTLEGLVYFAKTVDEIGMADKRVFVRPGYVSLMREEWQVPQSSTQFEVAMYNQYLDSVFPSSKLAVNQEVTTESRLHAMLIQGHPEAKNTRAIASEKPSAETGRKLPPLAKPPENKHRRSVINYEGI